MLQVKIKIFCIVFLVVTVVTDYFFDDSDLHLFLFIFSPIIFLLPLLASIIGDVIDAIARRNVAVQIKSNILTIIILMIIGIYYFLLPMTVVRKTVLPKYLSDVQEITIETNDYSNKTLFQNKDYCIVQYAKNPKMAFGSYRLVLGVYSDGWLEEEYIMSESFFSLNLRVDDSLNIHLYKPKNNPYDWESIMEKLNKSKILNSVIRVKDYGRVDKKIDSQLEQFCDFEVR